MLRGDVDEQILCVPLVVDSLSAGGSCEISNSIGIKRKQAERIGSACVVTNSDGQNGVKPWGLPRQVSPEWAERLLTHRPQACPLPHRDERDGGHWTLRHPDDLHGRSYASRDEP